MNLKRLKFIFLALCIPWLAQAEKPNVLLILVDDLKPAMGCYGDTMAKTPHMDALAKRGMRFDLAYCNQAVCAPSRFTLMLGSHSTSTGLYGLGSQLRQVVPKAVTMPQYFAKHGYRTESLGKVFHIGHGNKGDPQSFSVPHFHDKVIEYLDPASTDGGKLTREEALFTNQKLGQIRSLPRGAAFESPAVDDADYADGRVAEETIRRLEAAKERQGMIEGKIKELEATLATVQILGPGSNAVRQRSALGTRVTLKDVASGKNIVYTLVDVREADAAAGKISTQSPVGQAILDRVVGDEVTVNVPRGTVHYQVKKISG